MSCIIRTVDESVTGWINALFDHSCLHHYHADICERPKLLSFNIKWRIHHIHKLKGVVVYFFLRKKRKRFLEKKNFKGYFREHFFLYWSILSSVKYLFLSLFLIAKQIGINWLIFFLICDEMFTLLSHHIFSSRFFLFWYDDVLATKNTQKVTKSYTQLRIEGSFLQSLYYLFFFEITHP